MNTYIKNAGLLIIATVLALGALYLHDWAKALDTSTTDQNSQSKEVSDLGERPIGEKNCKNVDDNMMVSIGLSSNQANNDESVTKDGAVPDGRHGFGFVRKVAKNESGEVVLSVDPALWFSNSHDLSDVQNASLAAQEDTHFIDADAPNGFYIRNEKHITKEFVLPEFAEVYVVTIYTKESAGEQICDTEAKKVDANTYYKRAEKQLKEFPDSLLPIAYDEAGDKIFRLGEQYVP